MNYNDTNYRYNGGPLPVAHNCYNKPINAPTPTYNAGASVPSYSCGGYTVPAANFMKTW